MPLKVNLDAMIPREDFDIKDDATSTSKLARLFKASELEPGNNTLLSLRKPDFQRETSSWTPAKVANLIRSFLENELIPTVILWRSNQSANIFTIDGAHRLSALIAWVHDDYGDKSRSLEFFEGFVPPEQIKAAKATRAIVESSIGSYAQLKVALAHPENSTPERIRLAKNLAVIGIELQWVEGDAQKAEKSFKTINQQGEPINPVEFQMIEERQMPNALATRALVRAGTGHKYWSAFEPTKQTIIQEISSQVYHSLHTPEDYDNPIKTLDLPVAGRGGSGDAIQLLFNFVNFANKDRRPRIAVTAKSGKTSFKSLPLEADTTGDETIAYLKSVRRLVNLITGNHAGSLGLHPAVYYYSATGAEQPTAFLAAISFFEELDSNNKLIRFTQDRYRFEEFLVAHKHYINHIVQRRGSGERGLPPLVDLYRLILKGIGEGLDDNDVAKSLLLDDRLYDILRDVIEGSNAHHRKNFTTHEKSAVYLRDALSSALRCSICKARLHVNSISFDHVVRKQDSGMGSVDNGSPTHFYCNNGYKEWLNSKAIKERNEV